SVYLLRRGRMDAFSGPSPVPRRRPGGPPSRRQLEPDPRHASVVDPPTVRDRVEQLQAPAALVLAVGLPACSGLLEATAVVGGGHPKLALRSRQRQLDRLVRPGRGVTNAVADDLAEQQ